MDLVMSAVETYRICWNAHYLEVCMKPLNARCSHTPPTRYPMDTVKREDPTTPFCDFDWTQCVLSDAGSAALETQSRRYGETKN